MKYLLVKGVGHAAFPLRLYTSTVQLAAQKLYEKHGYREVGREIFQQFQIMLYEKVLG